MALEEGKRTHFKRLAWGAFCVLGGGMAIEQKHIDAAFWEAETRKKSGKYNVDEEGFDREAMAEHFRVSERSIQTWRNTYPEYKPLVVKILWVMGVKVDPRTQLDEFWADVKKQFKNGNAGMAKMLLEYYEEKQRRENYGGEVKELQDLNGIILRDRMLQSAQTAICNLLIDSQLEYKKKIVFIDGLLESIVANVRSEDLKGLGIGREKRGNLGVM